jgi:hypothetical protein
MPLAEIDGLRQALDQESKYRGSEPLTILEADGDCPVGYPFVGGTKSGSTTEIRDPVPGLLSMVTFCPALPIPIRESY